MSDTDSFPVFKFSDSYDLFWSIQQSLIQFSDLVEKNNWQNYVI